ncbi:MAG: copper resistance protein CopC [Alphaproteobacteria bacterium]|nr:copper resistance protein CopC [Alphaproteobacteria bacterium]
MAMAMLVALAASPALPHSRVDTTVPADGAVLDRTPAQVVLTFANGLRLTRVLLSHNDGPEIEVDPGSQTGFGTRFELAIEDRGSGRYRIEWRGLSADGHVMKNTLEFRVR